MRRIATIAAVSLLCASIPALAQYDDAREAARKGAEAAMAKAYADKARNDGIVEQQRAAEAARKRSTPTPSPSKVNPQ
jgi:hypothetical protein